MGTLVIVMVGVGLSMDACAVAIAASAMLRSPSGRQMFRLAFHFGFFQGMMTLLGWLAGSTIANLPVFSKVANFFIARTHRLQLVGWDVNLKRVDHTDFFTRAKGVLTTVYNADLKCLHAPTPYSSGYMQTRNDLTLELALLQAKYHKPS